MYRLDYFSPKRDGKYVCYIHDGSIVIHDLICETNINSFIKYMYKYQLMTEYWYVKDLLNE